MRPPSPQRRHPPSSSYPPPPLLFLPRPSSEPPTSSSRPPTTFVAPLCNFNAPRTEIFIPLQAAVVLLTRASSLGPPHRRLDTRLSTTRPPQSSSGYQSSFSFFVQYQSAPQSLHPSCYRRLHAYNSFCHSATQSYFLALRTIARSPATVTRGPVVVSRSALVVFKPPTDVSFFPHRPPFSCSQDC